MLKPLLIFLALSVTLGATAQKTEEKPTEPAAKPWARITDSTYVLRFPPEWTVDQSGLMGSRFFIYAPLDSADRFRENFNLIINDMSAYPDMTLEFLADGARQQVERLVTDVQVQDYRIMYQGKEKYYIFEYSGKQGKFDLHWKQHYHLIGHRFYVLTFTAEAPQFAAYLPTAERIFSSFAPK